MSSPVSVSSPLPPADLLFESMTTSASFSELGETQLTLLSEKPGLTPEDLLGKPITVTVEGPEDPRHFNGYVTRFGIGGHEGSRHRYHATVRPWLWFLTRTSDCRIFQEMTVPDIVKKVFEDHSAIAKFDFKLFRSYRTWNYCVQYRETDFNFVARLLEHEGIYWYFQHTDKEHKLILVDSQSAHDAVPGHETLPFYENTAGVPSDLECVSRWSFQREVRTGKVVLGSYDFERPSTDMKVDKVTKREHDLSDYEMFDYQGDYNKTSDASQWSEDRVDEQQARFQTLAGSANGQSIEVGRLLTLEQHPRADQNAEYLVTGISISTHVPPHESGGSEATSYQCEFSAIPSNQQFRPARRTPKPFVQGPQSAVVVGPAGEEIFTDKYGRVKVQFHWDREAKQKDLKEKSSCWVRSSHPWAGKNFGVIHIPRIGQEVIVDFLEGDPDQPLITGRVYNAEQMPPWDLPANATQSGILTRSSKGGAYDNANAIRFEDKKGSEQLWIHAEKNQDIEVENDETHWVGHDRKKTVDNDETVHVKHDRTETVDHNETITIGVDRTEKVGANETITIGASRKEKVGASETIDIGASRTETVAASESITIGSSQTISVGASRTDTVGGSVTQTIGGSLTQTVSGPISVTTPGPMTVMANGGFTVVAPGGTKTIDSFFDQTGGKSTAAFGFTLAVAGAATSISGINWQYQAVSFGATGFKNEVVSCAITHTGVKMDTATLDMSNGGVEFKFKALFFVG